MENTNNVKATAFMHSCYVRNGPGGRDGVVVSELKFFEDGTVEPYLEIIKEPKRKIYVTNSAFRNHDQKKEREHVSKLDIAEIYNCDMDKELFKRLNGYYPKGYVNRDIYNSPYIYGASASIEYLLKLRYVQNFEKTGVTLTGYTKGFLDIETSVEEGSIGDIVSIAYTHENHVYVGVVKKYFVQQNAENDGYTGCNIKTLDELANSILNPLVDDLFDKNKFLNKLKSKLPFKFHYFVADDDVTLIAWIFKQIHKNKTTFIGVWNMGFDMPIIIEALKKKDVKPEDIMCPPEVPLGYRNVWYQQDKKKVAHIVDKWDWCHITGYTQFYDSMSLYAKLRIAKGKESNYKLDTILEINDIDSKLTYNIPGKSDIIPGHTDWHRYMVKHEIYRYLVYMMWDAMSITCMDWQNQDIDTFYTLAGVTPIAKATKQTIRIHDEFYKDWINQGWVMGTSRVSNDFVDDGVPDDAKGGAVLSPYLLTDIGLRIYRNAPNIRTNVYGHVNDVDFSQMYPRTMCVFNICKETKLSTMTSIDIVIGNNVTMTSIIEKLHSYLANPDINCIRLASEFFNLPDHVELLAIFEEDMKSAIVPLCA